MLAHDKGSKSTKQGESVDPNVIDEAMIIEAIKEYNSDNNIITADNLQVANITQLSLSFKSLKSIKSLDGLDRIIKLQLDNNNIQVIENLSHLVNLTWLDLSFNVIEEIKGLDKLTQLEDLSLFDNKIEKINDGLDKCQNLNVFSIGYNKLNVFDELIQIFGYNKHSVDLKFKKLQVLNVRGNPFTNFDNDSEYRSHLIVNLPGLKYLDYQFIDDSDRKNIFENDSASQKFIGDSVKQSEYFKFVNQHEETENEQLKKKKEKEDSNMHLLDNLSVHLLQHEDLPKLSNLNKNQIDSEKGKFKQKVDDAVLTDIQKKVMEKNIKKMQNVENFKKAWKERISQSETETIAILRAFEKKKKVVFKAQLELKKQNAENGDVVKGEEKLQPLIEIKQYTHLIKDQLMEVEVQLVDELDTAMIDFHNKQTEILSQEIEPIITAGFGKIQEAIKDFCEQLTAIAKIAVEAFNPQQAEPELMTEEEEERFSLLENKETLYQTINTIKEALQDKQAQKAAEVSLAISKELDDFKNQVLQDSYERNRNNISQIYQQIEKYQTEINEYIQDEKESDEDAN